MRPSAGRSADLGVVFNDRRVRSRELADSIIGRRGRARLAPIARAELTRTRLNWGEPLDIPEQKVFLSVNDMADTLCCELRADTHFVSPADMVGLLRRIESVLVNAALREGNAAAVIDLHRTTEYLPGKGGRMRMRYLNSHRKTTVVLRAFLFYPDTDLSARQEQKAVR